MPQGATVRMQGLRELNRAFERAPKTLKREWRNRKRAIAEPTRQVAASRALSQIRRMSRSAEWAEMRVGITQKEVYVAPRQRGTRRRGPGKRPNLAPLLMDRAMAPALEQNEAQIYRDLDELLGTVGRDWER